VEEESCKNDKNEEDSRAKGDNPGESVGKEIADERLKVHQCHCLEKPVSHDYLMLPTNSHQVETKISV
jgi:hypothetical protein